MNGEIFTTEAGGGSYPEPPYVPEPDLPECEDCCETRDLTDVDGHLLCPHCKADYIFHHADYDDRMQFIRDNIEEQKSFYLHWFFDSLSEREKLSAVKPFFDQLAQEEREFQVRGYTAECKPDFADFMERTIGKTR